MILRSFLFHYSFQKYQASLPSDDRSKLDMSIEFLGITSKLIEIFHSNVPFMSVDDSRFKELHNCLKWLNDWQDEASKAPGSASERNKMTLSTKTFFDVRSMIVGFQSMVTEAIKDCPGTQILAWKVNTNLVENIFCQQRGYHGQNDNPRYSQYTHGMNSILLGQTTSTNRNNTGVVESLPMYRPDKLRN